MAQLLNEGIWPCTILDAIAGDDGTGIIIARVNAQISDGPDKGRRCTYEDQVNARSAPYVMRSLRAIGWKGETLSTVGADVAAWVKASGGASTLEVKHLEIKNGKNAGKMWDKVNSIGRGPKPLAAPKGDALKDADEAMRAALAAGGGASGDDEIPFASCDIALDVNPIAAVLR